MSNRVCALAIVSAAFLIASDAMACIPSSPEQDRKHSDVIAEGTFVIDSRERGEGHIEASRTLKGSRKKTYQVRWDSDALPEELPDCGVEVSASGSFEGFSLKKLEAGTYRLTGRWQLEKKDR
ncbi:exported protein of unknown function [uncultured Sphingopyxis sp.]|uniref:Lipoprotein n=1 Tax=uncultured Sphingopyxis sp. TaxID=310581 RepID=A0A1Y5PSP4_9SPHN|nr:hypothetical protein [uncultured Sphingopyxis sp.]SBV33009.1 exported protein of unknown function [uncultured Sphingopyxis sp.]